jgi:hypothetical protein
VTAAEIGIVATALVGIAGLASNLWIARLNRGHETQHWEREQRRQAFTEFAAAAEAWNVAATREHAARQVLAEAADLQRHWEAGLQAQDRLIAAMGAVSLMGDSGARAAAARLLNLSFHLIDRRSEWNQARNGFIAAAQRAMRLPEHEAWRATVTPGAHAGGEPTDQKR